MQSAIRFTAILCRAIKEGGAINTMQVSSILPGLGSYIGHLAQLNFYSVGLTTKENV